MFFVAAANSGTSFQVTTNRLESPFVNTPPAAAGSRSSHKPAIFGTRVKNSIEVSLESVSPEPKLMLPFELTNSVP